ncbi:glycosyltransferase [Rhodoferax sp.]|uniref:glycosyltransferase n=1 Tax=Rhodoferax sp. TaxID=50421 RepID=UPI002736087A|nr:glycosyltransferase [Rhodoferax sp.]MDP3190360.1 glycosyltransferase [Rhodoferax sp.]
MNKAEDINLIKKNPLVTFALFSYNQEMYIREAVESALAQTYEPLEIIISDDCSTDRTFDIIQEVVRSYRGYHRVVTVKNEENLGVLTHVLRRGSEALGEFIIMAAGDDISLPNRTTIIVERFLQNNEALCITSDYDLIDPASNLVGQNLKHALLTNNGKVANNFLNNILFPYTVIQGSTAAYRRNLYHQALPPFELPFAEDNYFNFLIYLLGGYVEQVDQTLVKYRIHPNALSNRGKKTISVEDAETYASSAAYRQMKKMEVFLWLADHHAATQRVDINAIRAELRKNKIIFDWRCLRVWNRLIATALSFSMFRTQQMKWQAFRLFGTFPRYQPKTFLSKFQGRYQR